MRHRYGRPGFACGWLLAGALFYPSVRLAAAQVGAQIAPNSVGTKMPSAAPGRDAAGGALEPGLKIVPQDFAKLRLAPGFLLALNVLDDSDMSGSYRIDQQGKIAVPVLGTIQVAGETVPEARTEIRNRIFEEQILKDPQVSLAVLEYTAPEVTIVGEVASPGKYPLLAPRSLVEVLALAGGATPAAGDQVEIVRGDANDPPLLVHYSTVTDPKSVQDATVDPGDTVQVKRAGIVYVLGAVNRPGGYVMQEQGTLNVLQALALANGTALAAKTGDLHILSKDANGVVSDTRISYKKLTNGKVPDPQLRAQDILYVPVDKLKAVASNSTTILSSVASASIYATSLH